MSGASASNDALTPIREELFRDEKDTPKSNNTRDWCRFQKTVQTDAQQSLIDMHLNRIKTLRKELDGIKETEWKYEPIDKYIGQSTS